MPTHHKDFLNAGGCLQIEWHDLSDSLKAYTCILNYACEKHCAPTVCFSIRIVLLFLV